MRIKTVARSLAGYKTFLLVFLGVLTAFGPLATDMYLPALPSMSGWFNTSASMVQLSLTASMFGLAVGQLMFGPMSDKLGRKSVLTWTLVLFIISTLLCIFSFTIEQFVVFRLLQGIAAAGGIVISRSISTDLFEGRDLAKMLAIVGAINGVAPVMAPVIGGTMVSSYGWQGIFCVLLFIGILLLCACFCFHESLPRENRAKSSLLHVMFSFKPLFTNRSYMGYTLQFGFAQAALFANIASAPFIMQEHYGFTPFHFSLCFGINAFAIVISAALAAKFKKVENGTLSGGIGLFVFSICEMIALFSDCPFWVYELFLLCILFSLGFCFTSSTTLAMDSGRQHTGSASALLGTIGFAFGGIVSPLVGIGNTLYATGIVFVVSAILSLLCIAYARKVARKQ
ncbi:MAG: multidrug effflux MFS transporter [Prevotellaceae bacterium]|nr:multidrug effflux MFS transporter [Prevotellaceae bacterium]